MEVFLQLVVLDLKMAVEKVEHVDEKVLHNFAKRLANNEPRLRKNALKKLKGWMEARSGNMKSTVVLKLLCFASSRWVPEECGRGYPRTRIRRFSCGRGRPADPPNKHICGRGPSADLKPRVLFAGPTSIRCANVPVLSNLRIDPYLDTAVGYVRKPVWLRGALGIVYWIQCNPTLPRPSADLMLANADYPRMWNLWIRTPLDRSYSGP